ncbi:RcnB family protein [Sphingomonas sp. GB1N7]|uniref:RcnB family protein n=1 Tax=Parasphingomonas caseinilytica TaxID=3096158 RepID=UPI002FC9B205
MKKMILAALAATVALSPLAATVAEAQQYQQRRDTTVVRRNGDVVQRTVTRQSAPQHRNWRKGERFDRRYAQNYRQIDYRQYRGLRAPPRGYHYVRSGNDAVLVGITSGLIAAVVAGAIR